MIFKTDPFNPASLIEGHRGQQNNDELFTGLDLT